MFNDLQENIKALNADVKNIANCEKAKKLRKQLLKIGLPLAIGGFLGAFICFILFATAQSLVPFFLFLPFGMAGAIGSAITKLALKIIVTGYTANLINETVGNNCPKCSVALTSEKIFCSSCGTKVRKDCPNCKHINDHKSAYCEKCGTNLN